MGLIEDIKRDREAGTPGNLQIVNAFEEGWSLDTEGENSWQAIGTDLAGPIAIYAVPEAFGMDDELDANIRRALRVSRMEAALLAAEELSEASEAMERLAGKLSLSPRMKKALAAYREAVK